MGVPYPYHAIWTLDPFQKNLTRSLLASFLGLFAAAHDLEIEWIVIKGVSDYADENKSESDSWRRFASVMAASLTAEILSDHSVFQNWPHYVCASGDKK